MYLSLAEHWTRNVNSLDKIKGANLSDVARAVHIYIYATERHIDLETKGSTTIYIVCQTNLFSRVFFCIV